jgi:hypothetical protein
LFGDDVLIIVVDVSLFFQGKDSIIGLRMVGHVLMVFFPLLLGAYWIVVVALLIVLIILVVSVVVILLVVVVIVVVLIIVMGVVGIHSFWIARVVPFGI